MLALFLSGGHYLWNTMVDIGVRTRGWLSLLLDGLSAHVRYRKNWQNDRHLRETLTRSNKKKITMTPLSKALLATLAVVVIGGTGFLAWAYRPPIEPITPVATSFDRATIARGATLAAMGNCVECHTANHGQPYAGGFALLTPFGTIYGSNITPDPKTGIGQWSEAAFQRAMHEGVRRDGSYLYPAFPYTHFTHVTDEDNRALYAYLMTRPAIENVVPPAAFPFPLNIRMSLAGWNLLFFDEGRYEPQAGRDAEWNRGAYIAQGLGHCSACHSPLNALGSEIRSRLYDGGEAEGWVAPALNGKAGSPIGWTRDELVTYLRGEFSAMHGVAAGPMQGVSAAIRKLPESDVGALATYIASLADHTPIPDRARAVERSKTAAYTNATANTVRIQGFVRDGAGVFASTCAMCHASGTQQPLIKPAPLDFSSAVHAPDARNLLEIVRTGIDRGSVRNAPSMPGFNAVLDDAQLEALANYVRGRFAPDKAAWTDVAGNIKTSRKNAEHAEAGH